MIIPKIKTKRKVRVFFIALLLSFFLWFINHLSGEFTVNVNIKVHTLNAPESFSKENFPDTSIQIEIKGSGFSLIRYSLKKNTIISLEFDQFKIQSAEDKLIYYIEKSELISKIQDNIPKSLSIINIDNDILAYSVISYPKKKIPVSLQLDFSCDNNYLVLGKIKIKPDSIIISGPQQEIDIIDSILSKKIQLLKLQDSVEIDVPLILHSSNCKYSKDKIKLFIPVTKVKKHIFIQEFSQEIEGVLYKKNIEIQAWIPEYMNELPISIQHRIKNKEIRLNIKTKTAARLISISPKSIPLKQ